MPSTKSAANELTFRQRLAVGLSIGTVFIAAAGIGAGTGYAQKKAEQMANYFAHAKEMRIQKAQTDAGKVYDMTGLASFDQSATLGQQSLAELFNDTGVDTRQPYFKNLRVTGEQIEALSFFAMTYHDEKKRIGSANLAWDSTVMKVKGNPTYGSQVPFIEKLFQKSAVAPKRAFNSSGPATGTFAATPYATASLS